MTTHTSQNLRVENGTAIVTETTYDEDDKPLKGESHIFTSQEEAEAYMNKTDDPTNQHQSPAKDTIARDDIIEANNTAAEPNVEKPASQMTEADAVALNSDVRSSTDPSARVVTQGQTDQVEAGLHPDPKEGHPIQD